MQRVVDTLNAFELRVLEALALSGTTGHPRSSLDDAAELLGAGGDRRPRARALAELLALTASCGASRSDRTLVNSVRESLGSLPGRARPSTARVLLRQVADIQLVPVLRSLGLGRRPDSPGPARPSPRCWP